MRNLLWIVLAFPTWAGAQYRPSFVVDRTLQHDLDLGQWLQLIWPELLHITNSAQPVRVITLHSGPEWAADCSTGAIYIPESPSNPRDINDPFYDNFTHEVAHLLEDCRVPLLGGFLREGYAEAIKNLAFNRASQRSAAVQKRSAVPILEEIETMKPELLAGKGSVYSSAEPEFLYIISAGNFELVASHFGGSLQRLDAAALHVRPKSDEQFLGVLDTLFPRSSGAGVAIYPYMYFPNFVLWTGRDDKRMEHHPPTNLHRFLKLSQDASDGKFLEMYEFSYMKGTFQTKAPVNPEYCALSCFERRNGRLTYPPATVRVTLASPARTVAVGEVDLPGYPCAWVYVPLGNAPQLPCSTPHRF